MTNTPNQQSRQKKTIIKITQIEEVLTSQEKTQITKYLIQKILEKGKHIDAQGELKVYTQTQKLQNILKNKGKREKKELQSFQKKISEPVQQELFATLNESEFAIIASCFRDVDTFNYQEKSRNSYMGQNPNITQQSINEDHITQAMDRISRFLYGKTFGQLFGIESIYPTILEQKRDK